MKTHRTEETDGGWNGESQKYRGNVYRGILNDTNIITIRQMSIHS